MINAARIREVLERHRNGLSQPSKELLSRINNLGAEIDALLRDLDAQGAAPATVELVAKALCRCDYTPAKLPPEQREKYIEENWRTYLSRAEAAIDAQGLTPAERSVRVEQAAWWCCDTSCEPRDKPCANCIDRVNAILEIVSGEQPASPSLALHTPTVEAQARLLYEHVRLTGAHGPDAKAWEARSTEHQQKWIEAIRALTSGAEAGERGDWMRGYNDSQVETQKTVYGASGNSDREASTERPLSEWSDDELFRTVCDAKGWMVGPDATPEASELRKRGWRPHHGSEAPVKESQEEISRSVPTFHRARFISSAGPGSPFWNHTRQGGDPDLDIIAYRPVPAKAEDMCQWCKGVGCHECRGTGDKLPSPAADAGEVERLDDDAIEKLIDEVASDIQFMLALQSYISKLHLGNSGALTLDKSRRAVAGAAIDAAKASNTLGALAPLRPASSEEQVERAHELRVLAQLLIEPRNRFGKIEARSAVSGNVSDLAKKYDIRPCEDTVEQVGEILRKTARAILASQATKPEDK